MRDTLFSQRIELYQERLNHLFDQIPEKTGHPDPIMAQMVTDMQIMMEELLAASEELEQKNEELAEAHVIIDAERHRYHALFDFAPDGYLVTDQSGTILEANRAAAAMLEVRQVNLVGKPLVVYIAEDHRLKLYQKLTDLRTEDQRLVQSVYEFETRIQPRKKEPFWALVTVAAGQYGERRDSAEPTYLWMIHDISQIKLAQQELKKGRDELEERVNERTKELVSTNKALKATMVELQRRNKELQEFAFAASHDLQEPLRKISKFGELVMAHADDEMDSESADYVRRMVGAARRMEAMISGLLEYARVSSQDQPFTRVDLNEVAEGVVNDLDLSRSREGAQVKIEPLPTIIANPVQMRQLLQNLISNAVKFHRTSIPPRVEIWSELLAEITPERVPSESLDEANWIELYVKDNGIGFEVKYLERMLQPFERLHGTGEYGGMGMGLAICRKIVERHSGKITTKSIPGDGSTFIITLPVKQESR